MNERPMTRGLFLCEKVVVEEGTRSVSLVNFFTVRLIEVEGRSDDFNGVFVLLGNPFRVEVIAAGNHDHFPNRQSRSLKKGLPSDA